MHPQSSPLFPLLVVVRGGVCIYRKIRMRLSAWLSACVAGGMGDWVCGYVGMGVTLLVGCVWMDGDG